MPRKFTPDEVIDSYVNRPATDNAVIVTYYSDAALAALAADVAFDPFTDLCESAIHEIARRDALAAEEYRDNQRIFQALCTERDRLTALRPGMVDRGTIEHTERLVERYAGKLRAVYSTDRGCYCVTLPSGRVLACDMCGRVR